MSLAPARADTGAHHTAYTEPHAIHGTWTSPPLCLPDRAAAERRVDAVTALAGPDAARRRTWSVTPCDGSCER